MLDIERLDLAIRRLEFGGLYKERAEDTKICFQAAVAYYKDSQSTP